MELSGLFLEAGPQHDVRTVADEGWKGLKNGALLQRMRKAGFAALSWLRLRPRLPKRWIRFNLVQSFT